MGRCWILRKEWRKFTMLNHHHQQIKPVRWSRDVNDFLAWSNNGRGSGESSKTAASFPNQETVRRWTLRRKPEPDQRLVGRHPNTTSGITAVQGMANPRRRHAASRRKPPLCWLAVACAPGRWSGATWVTSGGTWLSLPVWWEAAICLLLKR